MAKAHAGAVAELRRRVLVAGRITCPHAIRQSA